MSKNDFKVNLLKHIVKNKGEQTNADIAEVLRNLADEYNGIAIRENLPEEERYVNRQPEYMNEAANDFSKLQADMVDLVVKYIQKHKTAIYHIISEKRDMIMHDWSEEDKKNEYLYPDLILGFGIDNLESSVEYGSWCPASDSNIALCVGSETLLFNC